MDETEKLLKAVQEIVERGSPTVYNSPEDSVGGCGFCGNPSYRDHAADCEYDRLRTAWNEFQAAKKGKP